MENEKLLHDLQQDIEVPDSAPSWNALQPKLERRKRRKKLMRRTKIVTGLVCASLVVSIMIGDGAQRTYAHISNFFNDVIQVFLRKPADNPESALTVPPPAFEESHSGGAGLAKPEKVTLEEARQKLAFPLLLPSYVPEQLELSDIRIFKDADGLFRAVYLEYANAAGALVKVNQRLITDNSPIMTEIQDGTGTIKDVMIGEQYPGILLELSDGTIFIEWIASDVKMLLSGPLIGTEALQWAGAFQP
ncbi:hypothetical protein P8825_22075 [Shouchella clausii]|uniref:hypothetical protein n=1 Tax=Shouchella clausii TaxID=79880 RepID=UPI002DBE09D1|nr:hypothetical protein [Shouchella clausii]MEB5482251.1 hypothetical protein [Shouchella clausii]